MGKTLLVLGSLSVFIFLSTGAELTGWGTFTTNVSADPFANWTGFPSFQPPGTAINFTGQDNLYLRNIYNGWDACSKTDGLLTPELGSSVATDTWTVTQTGSGYATCFVRGYYSQHSDVTYNGGTWNVSLFLSQSGSGAQYHVQLGTWAFSPFQSYMNWIACAWNTQTTMGSPVVLSCDNVPVFTGLVAVAIWREPGGTGTLTLSFDDATTDSYIEFPGIQEEGTCNWYDLGCMAGGAFDWAGAALTFIGGTIWAVVSGFGAFLVWFFTLLISFFTSLISILVYLVGGAGIPAPASYIFQVTFIGFLGVIVFQLIHVIRGTGGPG